jgi:hypothetical protein
VNDVFLGTIAVSVLVIAILHVTVIVLAARAARRVGEVLTRLERDVRPIVTSLEAVAADASRVSASVASQVERADRLMTSLSTRVDEAVLALQDGVLTPARELLAILQVLRESLFGTRSPGRGREPRRGQAVEDEDALFIG